MVCAVLWCPAIMWVCQKRKKVFSFLYLFHVSTTKWPSLFQLFACWFNNLILCFVNEVHATLHWCICHSPRQIYISKFSVFCSVEKFEYLMLGKPYLILKGRIKYCSKCSRCVLYFNCLVMLTGRSYGSILLYISFSHPEQRLSWDVEHGDVWIDFT